MIVIGAGRAMLFRPPGDAAPHLWLVLTEPDGQSPKVVAAAVRTLRPYSDRTVVLQVGDHPFIKHDSTVDYGSARYFRVDKIVAAMKRGTCHLRSDLAPAVLGRVQRGLLESPHTIHEIKRYCRQRFGQT